MVTRAGRADGPRDWVTWIGAGLGAGMLAFGIGALGLVGRPPAGPAPVDVVGAIARDVAAFDCPDGSPVGGFRVDTVVLATARSEDGQWLAVRNPANSYETVWVASGEIDFTDPLDGLPVDGCLMPPLTRDTP